MFNHWCIQTHSQGYNFLKTICCQTKCIIYNTAKRGKRGLTQGTSRYFPVPKKEGNCILSILDLRALNKYLRTCRMLKYTALLRIVTRGLVLTSRPEKHIFSYPNISSSYLGFVFQGTVIEYLLLPILSVFKPKRICEMHRGGKASRSFEWFEVFVISLSLMMLSTSHKSVCNPWLSNTFCFSRELHNRCVHIWCSQTSPL